MGVAIHKSKLDKLMWDVIQVSFPLEEKCQTKLFRAMSNSYDKAFESSRAHGPPAGYERAEKFLKSWISDTLCRAWGGVENSESVLSPETVTDFFKSLICPLDESAFSCIPPPLLNGEERSTEEWEEVLQPMVHGLFEEW